MKENDIYEEGRQLWVDILMNVLTIRDTPEDFAL